MSEDKSVLVPVLIGCGLFGILCFLVCFGGMAFFVPRAMQQAGEMMDQVQQEMARQQMVESFPDGWRAPAAEATGEELFPQAIGNFSRLDTDTSSSPLEYGIGDLEPQHATYESALTEIDVYAYRVTDDEVRNRMQSVKDALGENFASNSHFSVSRSNYEVLTFSVSPPQTTGCVWSSDGWLFLILGEDQFAPAMFQTEYLDAILQPAPEEPQPEVVEPVGDAEDTSTTDTEIEHLDAPPLVEGGDFPPPPPRPEPLQSDEGIEATP